MYNIYKKIIFFIDLMLYLHSNNNVLYELLKLYFCIFLLVLASE